MAGRPMPKTVFALAEAGAGAGAAPGGGPAGAPAGGPGGGAGRGAAAGGPGGGPAGGPGGRGAGAGAAGRAPGGGPAGGPGGRGAAPGGGPGGRGAPPGRGIPATPPMAIIVRFGPASACGLTISIAVKIDWPIVNESPGFKEKVADFEPRKKVPLVLPKSRTLRLPLAKRSSA